MASGEWDGRGPRTGGSWWESLSFLPRYGGQGLRANLPTLKLHRPLEEPFGPKFKSREGSVGKLFRREVVPSLVLSSGPAGHSSAQTPPRPEGFSLFIIYPYLLLRCCLHPTARTGPCVIHGSLPRPLTEGPIRRISGRVRRRSRRPSSLRRHKQLTRHLLSNVRMYEAE